MNGIWGARLLWFCLVNWYGYLQDFESERKWKLAQAKKVALRASKGMLDQATREEKKLKVLQNFVMIDL